MADIFLLPVKQNQPFIHQSQNSTDLLLQHSREKRISFK